MSNAMIIGLALFAIIAFFFAILIFRAWINGRDMGIGVGFVAMGCPNFWEDMPQDDDDEEYAAFAGLELPFCTGIPREVTFVRGKRAAYVEARRLGQSVEFKEMTRNPNMSAYEDGSYPGSVGVYWAIQKKDDYLA